MLKNVSENGYDRFELLKYRSEVGVMSIFVVGSTFSFSDSYRFFPDDRPRHSDNNRAMGMIRRGCFIVRHLRRRTSSVATTNVIPTTVSVRRTTNALSPPPPIALGSDQLS